MDSMSIQDEAKQIVARIAKNYQPQKVVLFGSVASNQSNSDSDIDLLIIKDTEKKKPYRIKDVFASLRGLKRQYPLDTRVLTPKEIDDRTSLGDFFIQNALKGRVVYEA